MLAELINSFGVPFTAGRDEEVICAEDALRAENADLRIENAALKAENVAIRNALESLREQVDLLATLESENAILKQTSAEWRDHYYKEVNGWQQIRVSSPCISEDLRESRHDRLRCLQESTPNCPVTS